MKIAIMTGGGDCPGLNAIIQAIVTRAYELGYETLGILDGYKGLIDGKAIPLRLSDVKDIYDVGGTILGTSRRNPFQSEEAVAKVLENIRRFGIDALIVIGGDDTLGAALKLSKRGVPIIGIPKNIDNDLLGTDYSVGFWTAVETAAEAIKRLHTTAKSHRRVVVVEIMGRHAGWLALMAGLAGGAHVILIPEKPLDIEDVCEVIRKREKAGENYTVVAVAEGVKPPEMGDFVTISKERDEYGHVRLGGIAMILADEIKKRTGKETRAVILGHVQRGGSPNAFDKILGIRLGILAVDLIKDGKIGYAAVLKGRDVVAVKLDEVVNGVRKVPENLLELTSFFSHIEGGENE